MLQGREAVSYVFYALEALDDPMRDMELFTFFPYPRRHFSASSISKAFLNVRCTDASPTMMGTELWGRHRAWERGIAPLGRVMEGSFFNMSRMCLFSFPVGILDTRVGVLRLS